jgi:DNA-binding SARP family transcriptional activator
MQELEVRLFGGLDVSLDETSLGAFPTCWSAGLFAYLALKRGRLIQRDMLATLFWPEETDQQARKKLRTALWRARSHIKRLNGPAGTLFKATGQQIGLSREGVWVDVDQFDTWLSSVKVAGVERIEAMERSVSLYAGHFMDGYDFEWIVYERERLRLAFLSTLESLLSYHMERQEWALAIQKGHTILGHDPLREHVHQCLMLCHHLMGNRPLAIRQYQACARVLEEELGIAPMEATQTLCKEIEDGSFQTDRTSRNVLPLVRTHTPGSDVTVVLSRVEEALADLRCLANPNGIGPCRRTHTAQPRPGDCPGVLLKATSRRTSL